MTVMIPSASWNVKVTDHPGSSWDEILSEPDWAKAEGHNHHVGYKTRDNRPAGVTSALEDFELEDELADQFIPRSKPGNLLSFRDLLALQPDYHLLHPENRSLGWRYVLNTTENWVKYEQPWPANLKKKEKEEEDKKAEEEGKKGDEKPDAKRDDQTAPEKGGEALKEDDETPEQLLRKALKEEAEYMRNLQQNDGKGRSPQTQNRTDIFIDEPDQFTPDNWVTRNPSLIRLTGKHPLNAEPHLTDLFEGGLITPNELHYVRNHGVVPHLLWEHHKLDIQDGKLVLSMDDLKYKFDTVNIPVFLACDGNRRKELNIIRRSAGFSWGPGAASCAYWKGPLLRDVLLAAGLPEALPTHSKRRFWVNFEGAEDHPEGKYATCIPLQYAMDVTNDVILAYEMNDLPLPPDHGYPVRMIIPGYVGGRCVKWLSRIWITDHENTSHFHIWDNRVLPSFIKRKDDELAALMFSHPDTACNEQNLNSIIVRPTHGEKIQLTGHSRGQTYRVAGYAYDGGGHQIQRVEISLDDGATWIYCVKRFPEAPIRHDKKFWTWLHWHADVPVVQIAQCHSIVVRCFNVFKNTQPRDPVWNVMGMMNNCWYIVKPEIVEGDPDQPWSLMFHHPTVPGTGTGGWMQPSVENQMEEAKRDAGTPNKQFTRAEIEAHDKEDDCWIVVDGKVYDATSVIEWHPGGKSAILGHAGKVHRETTDEFTAIHDDFASQKLQECLLGSVTDKVKDFIKKRAEDGARALERSSQQGGQVALKKHRWVPVKLVGREHLSKDTRAYTFSFRDYSDVLGLGTCQHVQLGFHMKDQMLVRSYTPTKPILPALDSKKPKTNGHTNGSPSHADDFKNGGLDREQLQDGSGTFELIIKTYFPDDNQPGGAMSNLLDCMPIGEEIEIRGPTGEILYNGNGQFDMEGKNVRFKYVSLVLGGSGITPGYALLARIVLSSDDSTMVRVVDANKSEDDILLRTELELLEKQSRGRLQTTHVLSQPSDQWTGIKGRVNADIFKANLFPPGEDSVALMCGPPAMIQKAALPALKAWGYVEGKNVFGF